MPPLRPFRYSLFRRYRQFSASFGDRISSRVIRFIRPKLVKLSFTDFDHNYNKRGFEFLPPREAAQRVSKSIAASSSQSLEPSFDFLSALLPFGTLSDKNSITIFHDGDEAFSSMFEAIESARHSIHLETYMIKADAVGEKMAALLIDALRRGVKVTLIFDSWGSSDMASLWLGGESAMITRLRREGGDVIHFNRFRVPFIGKFLRGFRFFRDHRKVLIVDNIIAYTGGMNIAKQYCGEQNGGTGDFRDCQVRVEGVGAIGLYNVFMDSYKEAVGKERVTNTEWEEMHALYWKRRKERDDFIKQQQSHPYSHPRTPSFPSFPIRFHYFPVVAQVLMANTFRQSREIQKSMQIAISKAKSRVYITSPYFMPPHALLQPLQHAAENGVDVRVLLTGNRTDVPWARWACRYLYSSLIESGVRLYEFQEKTLHAKIISVDSVYSSIGSFNFDRLSYSLNLEVSLSLFNPNISRDLEDQFLRDIAAASEVTKADHEQRGIVSRTLEWVTYRGFSSVFEPLFAAAREGFKRNKERFKRKVREGMKK